MNEVIKPKTGIKELSLVATISAIQSIYSQYDAGGWTNVDANLAVACCATGYIFIARLWQKYKK